MHGVISDGVAKLPRVQRAQGFTIVELLVVIVVTGILATITVVAYNGMQTRAYHASLVSQVSAYERLLGLYKSVNGDYPGVEWGCLGKASDYPAENGFAAGQCSNGSANNYHAAILETSLAPYTATLPNASYRIVSDTYGGQARGLIFDTYNNWIWAPGIFYFVDGSATQCPIGIKLSTTSTSSFCVRQIS